MDFYFISFYFIFYSTYSNLFYSFPFLSILVYSFLFLSILFYYFLFYYFLFFSPFRSQSTIGFLPIFLVISATYINKAVSIFSYSWLWGINKWKPDLFWAIVNNFIRCLWCKSLQNKHQYLSDAIRFWYVCHHWTLHNNYNCYFYVEWSNQ